MSYETYEPFIPSWNNFKSLYEEIGSDSNWKTMLQWKEPIKLFVCLCVNQVTSGTKIFPLKTTQREHSLKEILRAEKVKSKKHHFDLV